MPEDMEHVTKKINKGLPLTVRDLQTWTDYNYPILPDED